MEPAAAVAADSENEAEIIPYKDARLAVLKADAQKLWKRKEAICNLEGFYQHYGECVNDVIQMFFTSSDLIKDAVQKQLIFTDYETFNFDTVLKSEEERALIDPEMLRVYMRAFQNRFLRHYLNEDIMCIRGEELARNHLYRAKGRNTKQAMTALKTKKIYATGAAPVRFKNFDASKSAIHPYYIPSILRILSRVLKLRKEFQSLPFDFYALEGFSYKPNLAGFIFGVTAKGRKTSHALCFYECGKKQFMYDDNRGPYRCEWRSYLQFMDARKAAGKGVELLFGRYDTIIYSPFLYLEAEKRAVYIEGGVWKVLDEHPEHPKMFPLDGGGTLNLTDGTGYFIQMLLPFYGGAGLTRQIAEPTRSRGFSVTKVAGVTTPFTKDPALRALLGGGGCLRSTRRRRRRTQRA